jgi:hypothetical protein
MRKKRLVAQWFFLDIKCLNIHKNADLRLQVERVSRKFQLESHVQW